MLANKLANFVGFFYASREVFKRNVYRHLIDSGNL